MPHFPRRLARWTCACALMFLGPAVSLPARTKAYDSLPWVYTGGPQGGLGYDVRMHADPDVMFVTDAWAGVFKSVDGGQSWFASSTGITDLAGPSGDAIPVFSLTVDPVLPDTAWLGTQNTSGVYRSDDAGANWHPMNNGILEKMLSVRGFTVDPANPDVVYLAGEIPSVEWNGGQPKSGHGVDMTRGAVYRTEDRGLNWERIWEGEHLARYVWIDPQDTELLYVSTGIFDREAANSDASTDDPGGVGVLRSPDGGSTWEVLDDAHGFDPLELYISSLYMNPDDPRILLAASGNDPYTPALGRRLGGVYLTEDGGDSWTEVVDGHNFSAVEYSETNPDVAYAGAVDAFYRSLDRGHTWDLVAGGTGDRWGPEDVPAGFPIDIQCDPRDPFRLFVNNYGGGNFVSEDGGVTWTASSRGYTGALMRQVAVARDDRARVYASARSGLFTSTDGGDTWSGMARGAARDLEGLAIAVDPGDSWHVLASLVDLGARILASGDGGQTWALIDLGWGGQDAVTQIAFSPLDPALVLATLSHQGCYLDTTCEGLGHGIVVSLDGGGTWSKTNLDTGNVLGLAYSHLDASLAYASVHGRGVFRSADAGQTWQWVGPRRPASQVAWGQPGIGAPRWKAISLAVDPEIPGMLYAGFSTGGVFVSVDDGAIWTPSSSGMPPEASVRDFAIDLTDPMVVYAATERMGVYVSSNRGQSWSQLDDGSLVTRATTDLALSEDGTVLYLATKGAGVLRLGHP